MIDVDVAGSIGRRYRRQDEIGTPFCVTVDFESLEATFDDGGPGAIDSSMSRPPSVAWIVPRRLCSINWV